MPYSSLFSIMFFSVCIASLVMGIFVLQNDRKKHVNRCFFALIASVSIWSAGLAIANSAPDAATCEIWRRFSAVGWGTVYSIMLHFVLIITGRVKLLKKWWFYVLLYLPAAITVLAYAIPSGINQTPYHLQQTEFGWVNVAQVADYNIWDWVFLAYYVGYSVTGLILVLLWNIRSSDHSIKMQSRAIFLSFTTTLIIGSLTDLLLGNTLAKLPQMAPLILLIPITTLYYSIKKYGFIVTELLEKKSSYTRIIIFVILYVILSALLIAFSSDSVNIGNVNISTTTLRGIIIQLQMLISVYLVIRENKPGFIASVLMNIVSIVSSVAHIIRNSSIVSLPGVISYLGVLMITGLIASYKKHTALNIEKINNQRKSLEESEKSLYRMAYYDSLTGLPNKELFVIELNKAIRDAKKSSPPIGVMFIDLDSFKSINDTIGHTNGDIVLKEMALRLSSCLRKEDVVSRYGGDEFLIKISGVEKSEELYKISSRIMDAFKKAVTVNNVEYFVSASAGVAVYPADGEDSDTLIKNADIAMYSAKSNGKKQCVYCSAKLKNDTTKKLTLTNSLYTALDKNELFLVYQPQVKMRTKEIVGFEALLRWNNAEYGLIPPDVFIPMAEQTGLIRPIGLWVLRTACEQFKRFKDIYYKDITISVNLSVEQLKDSGIVSKIRKILYDTQADPAYVQLEVTESSVFNREPHLLKRLQDIKNLGISISIDDFGTGHSSLSRLKVFPIDLLKIDMEFVHGISSESEKDKAIIKSIIQVAKNLGIEVLAEGVETEDQYMYLRKEECDIIQGYYFYKPMPANEIETLLNSCNTSKRVKAYSLHAN